tara:strand:- start:5149 stop:5535 length:387 start_codon:yes stop_codon:yes gene_type:complete
MKKKILIVSANYYDNVARSLISSAINELNKFAKIDIIKVPGVFEIPITIVKKIKKYDGFLALGCVIQGETPHFEFISKSSIDAIMKISVNYKKPIGNGILTCLNKKQAQARGKKGAEAARAVKSILSQ